MDFDSLLNIGKDRQALPYSAMGDGNTSTGMGGDLSGFDSLKFFGNAGNSLGGIGALLQAYNGYKQLQQSKNIFNFQRSAYNQDSANQAKLVNSQLEDRQRSRISSTGNNNAGGVYQSLGSYLDKNRVAVKRL